MCQNIDKQNISVGIYNSFRNNAHIFIRNKTLDSLICRIGGGGPPKYHKRPELVLISGMNVAASPQGAESVLGRRPHALAFPLSHLHSRSPVGDLAFSQGAAYWLLAKE